MTSDAGPDDPREIHTSAPREGAGGDTGYPEVVFDPEEKQTLGLGFNIILASITRRGSKPDTITKHLTSAHVGQIIRGKEERDKR